MKITSVASRVERFALTRPYAIAFRTIDAVESVVVELHAEGGLTGLGAASPEPRVTGETDQLCQAALAEPALEWLIGRDTRTLPALCRELKKRLPATPAARAAIDVALHDLLARHLGMPLADVLGRVHDRLPTSITIGIKPARETLKEAVEHLERGFRVLKVKLGRSLEEDLDRLHLLRDELGPEPVIRVDPNQGYDRDQLIYFAEHTAMLDLEFIEQPLPADQVAELRTLPAALRKKLAADESLLDERDALNLAIAPPACGIFNVKLMKCGGLYSAGRIAAIAETAGIELMWGCMDESRIGIAAALHAALASPATRYLDLDGSFDLERDVVEGGFVLEDGCLSITDSPGLGVRPLA